ncbi:hypothetical protein BZA77DRAFT_363087 [Pyronema omphalodes]|nr:hypothetical protein BZA77DRAFT_363087 [Pyronema omphalodes]
MAEYFCLPSVEQAECFLGLRKLEPALTEEKSEEDTGPPDFSISFWSLKKRMDIKPQKELFGRWLIHVFLKIVIPFSGATVCQPLTLATFVRLCIYLVDVRRIPAHWISDVVDKLLMGSIRTSARPPAHLPQELYEVTYINSNKKNHGQIKDFKVAAFIPELKSLLTRYQLLLPFHLLTPLPLRSEVTKYTINMELDLGVGPTTMMNIFSFILARNATTRGQEWGRLHKLLSQGQGVDDAYFYTNFEVKVLDSNVWSHLVEIAWWMEEGVAEAMKSHKWGALMVRIDNWTVVGSLKEATETMKKVSVW